MTKKITIHDIARELGIDSSTVSRALNDSPRVGKKTKDKVDKMAKKMGYQRNLMASNLRSSKTMTIGVVVPFISRHVLSEIIDGIEQVTSEKGYRVIISQTYDDKRREDQILHGMFLNRVDGLLISPSAHSNNEDKLKEFLDNKIPVVLFDRYFANSTISKVIINDKEVSYAVTDHILKQGKKKLIHLTGNLSACIYKERRDGFRAALEDNGIDFSEKNVKSINLYADDAVKEIEKIIELGTDLPDAIVCANDVTALGIIKYIDEKTPYNVPQDIAVSGFSNSPSSDIIKPGLTTVNQYPKEVGKAAANMLLDYIQMSNEERYQTKTTIVRSDIVVRESTVE